jgi:hypothetical protein|tara:strand:+ start:65 stop:583 length:519 start_codon:yes stop_codon:yes gene_type:complete
MKYPKFILLIITILIATQIFSNKDFTLIQTLTTNLGYIGAFILGIMYVYSFTAAPATSLLLILATQQNILLTGLIAGLGSLTGDLIIFKLIRHSFDDEIQKLKKKKWIKKIKLPNFITILIAYVIIAAPLPDEIGVTLLAAHKKISTEVFSIFAYLLNTAGIFVVLIIGRLI